MTRAITLSTRGAAKLRGHDEPTNNVGRVGCIGTWTLQDHHTTPPFDTEPPHVFRVTLARESKSFHFVTFGGGPGPVSLSGTALLDRALGLRGSR